MPWSYVMSCGVGWITPNGHFSLSICFKINLFWQSTLQTKFVFVVVSYLLPIAIAYRLSQRGCGFPKSIAVCTAAAGPMRLRPTRCVVGIAMGVPSPQRGCNSYNWFTGCNVAAAEHSFAAVAVGLCMP